MKEIITVQLQVEVEYNSDREGARDHAVNLATKLHLCVSGAGPTGFYSANLVKGSEREVKSRI